MGLPCFVGASAGNNTPGSEAKHFVITIAFSPVPKPHSQRAVQKGWGVPAYSMGYVTEKEA